MWRILIKRSQTISQGGIWTLEISQPGIFISPWTYFFIQVFAKTTKLLLPISSYIIQLFHWAYFKTKDHTHKNVNYDTFIFRRWALTSSSWFMQVHLFRTASSIYPSTWACQLNISQGPLTWNTFITPSSVSHSFIDTCYSFMVYVLDFETRW